MITRSRECHMPIRPQSSPKRMEKTCRHQYRVALSICEKDFLCFESLRLITLERSLVQSSKMSERERRLPTNSTFLNLPLIQERWMSQSSFDSSNPFFKIFCAWSSSWVIHSLINIFSNKFKTALQFQLNCLNSHELISSVFRLEKLICQKPINYSVKMKY